MAEFDDGEQHLIWVVPAPAASAGLATEIALFAPRPGDPRIGAASGIVFTSPDIETTYEELKSNDVEFSLELIRHAYGTGEGDREARFRDPDGNEFLPHTLITWSEFVPFFINLTNSEDIGTIFVSIFSGKWIHI
jgi:catechol 2,3-dioxygenase-like lactoylglutathione lyase family enzyme